MRAIYFDNNATTPVLSEVLKAMLPYFSEHFGNPSSSHRFGMEAARAVKKAREQVAQFINCEPEEIFWTSGGTESNNLSLMGCLRQNDHALTYKVEHKSILDVFEALTQRGVDAQLLSSNSMGQASVKSLEPHLKSNTRLVSVMAANNEVGSLNPVEEIGRFLKSKDILFHCDAVQILGKLSFDVKKSNLDLASFSAHKLYGPKGVGALYKKKGLKLEAIFRGGSQELGLRPGTLNVPGIVGFGRACELQMESIAVDSNALSQMRDQLFFELKKISPDLILNGHLIQRLPGHLHFTAPEVSSTLAALYLAEFAFSRGSACAQNEPSHVLSALNISSDNSYRIGLGRQNTWEECEYFLSSWRKITQLENPAFL